MGKLKKLLSNPRRIVNYLNNYHLLNFLPDVTHLKLNYWAYMGKKLNLENPQTFNEKLQWLKLYDHRSEYTQMVDKYRVREYIAQTIGEEYLIPLLGVWDDPKDIDFDQLPEQFVLKCNHDSGGLVICKDKSKLDIPAVKIKLRKCLKRNYYNASKEWPYKNIKTCIIAEQYLVDDRTKELRDYKFFTFNGKCRMMFIASNRQSEENPTAFDFYDMDFNHLDIRQGHPNAKIPPEKPQNFTEMAELAEKLSEGIPHVRVDFFEMNGKIYFGELTFFHYSGSVPFDPPIWDETFGSWLELPQIHKTPDFDE